jgi:hypothetical protein
MGLVAIGMIVSDKDGGLALLTTAVVAGVGLILFRHYTDEKDFVTYVFLAALCTRLIAGMLIHTFDIRAFAGPDAYAYDYIGGKISDYWQGLTQMDPELQAGMSLRGSGWGMNYLMGVIYFLFGKSIFIAQSFCATVGAATAPLVYFCSQALFNNKRVSKFASIGVACFPAFIIWSSQLLKDGLIVFLLVLAMTLVIQLQRSISWLTILFLILSLFSILSLRFYIRPYIFGRFAYGWLRHPDLWVSRESAVEQAGSFEHRRVGLWVGLGRFDRRRGDNGGSRWIYLPDLRSLSMGNEKFSSEFNIAGRSIVVVDDTTDSLWSLVHPTKQIGSSFSDPYLYAYAHHFVFGLSRKSGRRISTTHADTGFSVYIPCRWVGVDPGTNGRF